ncbi:RNA-directed DNA polymerase, eukaryota [Tanacetum coccineum]|uniref:RNA-directed DNA polymerase, eukaryota n=1 Tax=Tanacetum coccineum TaxID=301880 RepID=A0ABQ5D6S0_9ASTR
MGDFNEVRHKDERYGSIFNARGADAFNSFISAGGLVEVSSGGYSFTWSHNSASKMSKLDRFLVSDNLQRTCPNLSSLTLDRFLSDHRPILLRELNIDYGPTPFCFFHNWFELEGFDAFVADTWQNITITESNAMIKLAKKLKMLKGHIRASSSTHIEDRLDIMNHLSSLDNTESIELAQKAKVKWSIKGDENSKKFHGIINKRHNNLVIRGTIIDGEWIEDPNVVKNEFLSHFQSRFEAPCANRLVLDMVFPNRLSPEQAQDLERVFVKEEIKEAVWDCGLDKSPSPDGGNSSFIALIPKFQGDKMVNDYRPISLISSLYKIITKLLANRLVTVIDGLVNEVQSAFIANRQILDGPFILNEIIHWCKAKKKQTLIFKVDFEKAFDSVRWDFLDDVLKNLGFGSRWRDWIQSCLNSSKGSILVNGSPTSEFQYFKGLKQGDPLSPFLFILVMESLHLSFQKVVNAGLYKGVILDNSQQISHLFYADDVVFIGQWCDFNILTIIRVLDCFFQASGMRINLYKCKIMGISVDNSLVTQAANSIGCLTFSLPF